MRRSRAISLIAPAVLLFTACQSPGDSSFAATSQSVQPTYKLTTNPPPPILTVKEGISPGQVLIRFGDGATPASVRAIGHDYGLELSDWPLMRGPLAAGSYGFQTTQAVIEPVTPTTAIVLFPSFTKASDRRTFLQDNQLRLIRWLRPDDGYVLATVKLPPANLHPELIDPIEGRFRIELPAGLTEQSVIEWAAQNALQAISYMQDTGTTIVHPNSWTPPLQPIAPARPQATAPPPPEPPQSFLYVQFAATTSSDAVASIARGLGVGFVNLTSGGLALFSVDPARVKAEIQLLSDMAIVQCVATSPAGCAAITSGTGAAPSSPSYQQLAQPVALAVRVVDGALELDWAAAAGATAYAIFESSSASGPYQLSAVVAGQQHTAFQAFEVTPLGGSTYYQVVALHPCSQAAPACDASAIVYLGASGASAIWTNPAPAQQPPPQPAPVTASPTPQPSPTAWLRRPGPSSTPGSVA